MFEDNFSEQIFSFSFLERLGCPEVHYIFIVYYRCGNHDQLSMGIQNKLERKRKKKVKMRNEWDPW